MEPQEEERKMDEQMKELSGWVVEKLKKMAETDESQENREWAFQQLVQLVLMNARGF